jgi:hypothetical protein
MSSCDFTSRQRACRCDCLRGADQNRRRPGRPIQGVAGLAVLSWHAFSNEGQSSGEDRTRALLRRSTRIKASRLLAGVQILQVSKVIPIAFEFPATLMGCAQRDVHALSRSIVSGAKPRSNCNRSASYFAFGVDAMKWGRSPPEPGCAISLLSHSSPRRLFPKVTSASPPCSAIKPMGPRQPLC